MALYGFQPHYLAACKIALDSAHACVFTVQLMKLTISSIDYMPNILIPHKIYFIMKSICSNTNKKNLHTNQSLCTKVLQFNQGQKGNITIELNRASLEANPIQNVLLLCKSLSSTQG